MSKFIEEPELKFCDSDSLFQTDGRLLYHSDLLDADLEIQSGFYCDLSSIPLHIKWAHRESLLHDGMFRTDFTYLKNEIPTAITFMEANKVFLEAMTVKGKSWWLRYGFYLMVSTVGWLSWHKKPVDWKPDDVPPVCGEPFIVQS